MSIKPLRFANFLAFNINPAYVAICEEVERLLGVPAAFEEGQTFDQFHHDEIDVGYICGLPYGKMIRFEEPPFSLLVAPVLMGPNYAGRPVYYSSVIVHRDSPFQAFDDLRGCSFAYNEIVSYSGYHIMTWYLAQRGLDWSFFGPQYHAGAHLKSIAAVANRQADVAAIDSHALDVELTFNPNLNDKLRVVSLIGPSPMPPVVVGRGVSAELKAQLRDLYLNLHHNPTMRAALATARIERFVEVDDAYYDTIRERVDLASMSFGTLIDPPVDLKFYPQAFTPEVVLRQHRRDG